MPVRVGSSPRRHEEISKFPMRGLLESEERVDSPVTSAISSDSSLCRSLDCMTLEDSSLELKRGGLHELPLAKNGEKVEETEAAKPLHPDATAAAALDPVLEPIENSVVVRRPRSTIRKCDETLDGSYVDVEGPWKRLHCPNMEAIRAATAERMAGEEEPRQTRRRRVRFSSVQIRCYGQTVGDNPAVSTGAPIQLDWYYNEAPPVNINLYLAGRKPPRRVRQLVLSRYYRHKVLMHWYKVSEEDIRKAKRAAKKVRKQRTTSAVFSEAHLLEDCMFSTIRKVARRISTKK